jgi:hypothetical protein
MDTKKGYNPQQVSQLQVMAEIKSFKEPYDDCFDYYELSLHPVTGPSRGLQIIKSLHYREKECGGKCKDIPDYISDFTCEVDEFEVYRNS